MKLQLKRAPVVYAPHWHPNFRNTVALPDLKVIRTTFFINVACITVAAAALLFTVYREYTAYNLRDQIASGQARIKSVSEQNAKLLAMNKEFAESTRKFTEVSDFVAAPFVGSDLLRALSRSLPRHMEFTAVIWENEQLVLRGTISGASETATSHLTAYLDVLRGDEAIGPKFPDISPTSLLRDPRTQGMTFEITLKREQAKSDAKDKRKRKRT